MGNDSNLPPYLKVKCRTIGCATARTVITQNVYIWAAAYVRDCHRYNRCDYCAAACSGGGSIVVDVTNESPIPVLDGFGFALVSLLLVLRRTP